MNRRNRWRMSPVLPLYFLPALCLCWMAGLLLGRMCGAAWPCWVSLALAAAALVFLRDHRRVTACALTLCLGAVLGFVAWHPTLPEAGTHEVTGCVAEEVRVSDGKHIRTVLRDVSVDGQRIAGGLYWTMYADEVPEAVHPGARLRVTALIYHPSAVDNPGGFDFREYLLQQNIRAGLYGGQDTVEALSGGFSLWGLAAGIRHRLSLRLQNALGEETGAYAATMILGARSLVPEDERAAFNRLGISHILSVSGFHVGVLIAALGAIYGLLHLSKKRRFALDALVLTAYCLLTGLHAPVLRAAILVLAREAGLLRNRRSHGLHLLCLAAMMTLLFFPTQLTSPSFHLTYGALLGLILVTPMLERLFPERTGLRGWLRQALCSGVAVQLGILLPLLYWYQEVSLWGFVLNAPVLAFSSLLIVLDWLALLLGALPFIGPLLARAVTALTGGFLRVIRSLGNAGGGTLWTAQANLLTALGWCCVLVGCALFVRLSRRQRKVLALTGLLLMALSVYPLPHRGSDYIQLSVGNADAAVLHDRGEVVVIDTGEDGLALSQYLKQRRLSVDALILTHLHRDHAGGVQALLDERIPVSRCYIPEGAREAAVQPEMVALLDALEAKGTAITAIAQGDVLPLPSGGMTVVWPMRGKVRPMQDANESSLAIWAEVQGTSLLLTGDLDGRYENYVTPRADILKVAHHGSSASTSAEYLKAVAPQTLILSCGDDKRPVSLMERAGALPIYSTRSLGAVTVTFSEDGYIVQGYREP